MIWHRANETVNIEPCISIKRTFLYGTPVLREDLSDYFGWTVGNEFAVSLIAMQRSKKREHYSELVIKQAMWTLKHLCEYTDIPNTGTRLRLSVSTNMRDIATPYLEACNLPESMVYWFENRDADYPYISKFDAMRQPDWADTHRFLHLDAVLLIGMHPTQQQIPLMARVNNAWSQHQPLAFPYPIVFPRSAGKRPSFAHFIDRESALLAACALSGDTPEQERSYWKTADPHYKIGGWCFGITRKVLEERFFNRVLHAISKDAADESALEVYCRLKHYTNENVAHLRGIVDNRGRIDAPYRTRTVRWTEGQMPLAFWLKQHRQYMIGDFPTEVS